MYDLYDISLAIWRISQKFSTGSMNVFVLIGGKLSLPRDDGPWLKNNHKKILVY